ncbi:MAG: hypothetical protein ACFB0E_13530 [Leptolyngbyaceae cyanobacterium]
MILTACDRKVSLSHRYSFAIIRLTLDSFTFMTELLEQAIAQLRSLDADRQDAIARP